MSSPLASENDSLYRHCRRKPDRVFMTIVDEDGSVLYENGSLGLLHLIVRQDDVKALDQYLTNAPWSITRLLAFSNEDEDETDSKEEDPPEFDVFRFAAQSGSLETIQKLLAHVTKHTDSTHHRIRFQKREYKLLHEAARYGQIEIVRYFLNNQPIYSSIHDRDCKANTAVISAADIYCRRYIERDWNKVCPENNEAVINLLLDWGASASDVALPIWNEGKTPDTVLTLAVRWASPALINRLIDNGADIHEKVSKGPWSMCFWNQDNWLFDINALCLASISGNFKALKTLIDRRGKVNTSDMVCSRDSSASLPLHWATRYKLSQEARYIPVSMRQERTNNAINIIGLLLDSDPTTINVQNDDGDTALHYAARYFGPIDEQATAVIQFLCDRGADASICNNKKQTPLHTLFYRLDPNELVDIAAISILVSHGAKTTDADSAGNTALHLAAKNLLHFDAVSHLLELGADASIQNHEARETPVHIAAHGFLWGCGYSHITTDQHIKMQDDMLARLVEVGGVELMDQANGEGNSPRQISKEWQDHWRWIERLKSGAVGNDPYRGRGKVRGRGGRGRGMGRVMGKLR